MNGCDNIRARSNGTLKLYLPNPSAQLFSNNAFSANTFSLNVSPSFTAYSQSIVNTNNFFTYFHQRKQISRKLQYIQIIPTLVSN